MPSLLSYGDQAFWVSNATKDLLYELAIEVAKRGHPIAYQRLTEDARLAGCYGVSGLGFELEAFAEAFGSKEAWADTLAGDPDAVAALCSTPACFRLIVKLMAWTSFLLEGGRCNDAAGNHPRLDDMPEVPDTMVERRPVDCNRPEHSFAEAPGPFARLVVGTAFGAIIGSLVGLTNLLLGLAANWLTLPAWTFAGALLGSTHPLADLVLHAIIRLGGSRDESKDPAAVQADTTGAAGRSR